ncbi:DUF6346 domain-containing protein [Micromonospora sp. NPDC020750]|uniref:DUF6346 domain-containing protein n=1 Tax=unclassified Micromonospora TaxID=2617518 RepID=UPI0037A19109
MTQFAVVVAAIVGSTLVFDTLASFHPGTGAGKSTPAERSAEATVRDCRRAGPVSGDGLGCWWRCAVAVQVSDGREVETVAGGTTGTTSYIYDRRRRQHRPQRR